MVFEVLLSVSQRYDSELLGGCDGVRQAVECQVSLSSGKGPKVMSAC